MWLPEHEDQIIVQEMESHSQKDSARVSAEYLKRNPRNFKPNLVILGAGASIQAFPNGDKDGRVLPSMGDLCAVTGIEDKLAALGADETQNDFEAVYSRLYSEHGPTGDMQEIEREIAHYFSEMRLPHEPTLYDHLLLSLRPLDLIATFNWDPFLYDSWERLRDEYGMWALPQLAFLHGNVRVGYCPTHNVYGNIRRICPDCETPLIPSPLLYPVENKDYDKDVFIRDAWSRLRAYLREAFAVTIFGYSAPASDRAAFDTMKQAWNQQGERQFETLFFVDVKPKDEILSTWRPFLFSQHYDVKEDFYRSLIPRFARRSIEALMVPTLEGKFVEEIAFPRGANWEQLSDWYHGTVEYEEV